MARKLINIHKDLADWNYISLLGKTPNIMINLGYKSVDVCLGEDYVAADKCIATLESLIELIKQAKATVDG